MKESTIQTAVIKYALSRGMIGHKLDFGEGWPDWILLAGGYAWFIEFKQRGEAPTRLQQHVHGQLRSVGHKVEVIDDIDLGCATIDYWLRNLGPQTLSTGSPGVRVKSVLRRLDARPGTGEDEHDISSYTDPTGKWNY